MKSLTDALRDEATHRAMTLETAALIDAEVSDKGGISGVAIKAGYKTIKGLKPGFIEKVVGDLLPEFGRALSPFEEEARAAAQPLVPYFAANSERIANALLAITDAKAARSSNKAIKGSYEKLRGLAKNNVEQAVPRLAAIVAKHTA